MHITTHQILKQAAEVTLVRGNILDDLFLDHDLDILQRHGGGHRMTSEGNAVGEAACIGFHEHIGDFVAHQAAADRLIAAG